jgi:hypothetical protein
MHLDANDGQYWYSLSTHGAQVGSILVPQSSGAPFRFLYSVILTCRWIHLAHSSTNMTLQVHFESLQSHSGLTGLWGSAQCPVTNP